MVKSILNKLDFIFIFTNIKIKYEHVEIHFRTKSCTQVIIKIK